MCWWYECQADVLPASPLAWERLVGARFFGLCFFFQAEDGIRDRTVTGVQTCALPICCRSPCLHAIRSAHSATTLRRRTNPRSEERRVGKGVDLGGRRSMKKKKKRKCRRR